MKRNPFLPLLIAFVLACGLLIGGTVVLHAQAAPVIEHTPVLPSGVALTTNQAMTLTIPGRPPVSITPVLPNPKRPPAGLAPIVDAGPLTGPAYYYVRPGDNLYTIAQVLGVDAKALMAANGMTRPDTMEPGYFLRVPGPDGSLPVWATPEVENDGTITAIPRKTILERMTPAAKAAGPDSPYYNKIWITYYGRPHIDLMGIVGEYDPISLTQKIKEKAAEYDAANGPLIGVQPAVHLVWGMATVEDQPDNSHIGYLPDEDIMPYIEEGLKRGVAVILDSQIAGLSPSASISPALPYLKYPNVHLAIDPEFAMSHPHQYIPGNPIGYITAEQVNEVEQTMADYMRANGITGKRILMVHQFQSDMIIDKENLNASFPEVELTLSVDGFGNPYVKTWKYNALVDDKTPFTSFKLFYGWDDPLMTPAEALGIDATEQTDFIEITPNMIQYQ